MILETLLHGDSVFVTLTYNDENYPKDESRRSQRADVRAFFQRLRRALPKKFRYFLAPEFGPRSGRLHYHGILFGLSTFDAAVIEAAWGKGFVQIGEANEKTIRYTAKYVTKGDSRNEEEKGKPTRCFVSRNPGIGYGAMEVLGPKLQSYFSDAEETDLADVPKGIRYRTGIRPLGRYLTGKLRLAAGNTESGEPGHLRAARLAAEQVQATHSGDGADYRKLDQRRQTLNDALTRLSIAKGKETL